MRKMEEAYVSKYFTLASRGTAATTGASMFYGSFEVLNLPRNIESRANNTLIISKTQARTKSTRRGSTLGAHSRVCSPYSVEHQPTTISSDVDGEFLSEHSEPVTGKGRATR